MDSTKEVVDHHQKCFFERDLGSILSDYSTSSILFTPIGPLMCTDAMTPLFQAMFAEFGKPGAVFNLQHKSDESDNVYILRPEVTTDNVYEIMTDTFVVQNGKIVAQLYAAKIVPKGWKTGFRSGRKPNKPIMPIGWV